VWQVAGSRIHSKNCKQIRLNLRICEGNDHAKPVCRSLLQHTDQKTILTQFAQAAMICRVIVSITQANTESSDNTTIEEV